MSRKAPRAGRVHGKIGEIALRVEFTESNSTLILEWFLPGPGGEAAESFLERLLNGQAMIFDPSSLFYELSKVLWVRRQDGVIEGASLAIWLELKRLPLAVVDWIDVLPEALSLSHLHGFSLYDAVFVQLALNQQCDLITANPRLVRQAARPCPWVKPLQQAWAARDNRWIK